MLWTALPCVRSWIITYNKETMKMHFMLNPPWYQICFVLEDQVTKTCRGNTSRRVYIWGSFAGFSLYFLRKSLFPFLMLEGKVKKWHKIRTDSIIDDVWIISNLRRRKQSACGLQIYNCETQNISFTFCEIIFVSCEGNVKEKVWLAANLLRAFDKDVKGNSRCFKQIQSVQIELIFNRCMRI